MKPVHLTPRRKERKGRVLKRFGFEEFVKALEKFSHDLDGCPPDPAGGALVRHPDAESHFWG